MELVLIFEPFQVGFGVVDEVWSEIGTFGAAAHHPGFLQNGSASTKRIPDGHFGGRFEVADGNVDEHLSQFGWEHSILCTACRTVVIAVRIRFEVLDRYGLTKVPFSFFIRMATLLTLKKVQLNGAVGQKMFMPRLDRREVLEVLVHETDVSEFVFQAFFGSN